MITELKEINKYLRAAKQNFNRAIELARKNVVVGEIQFQGPAKVRKPRKINTNPAPADIPEKVPRGRKTRTPKNLPDRDKDGYMKERGPTTGE